MSAAGNNNNNNNSTTNNNTGQQGGQTAANANSTSGKSIHTKNDRIQKMISRSRQLCVITAVCLRLSISCYCRPGNNQQSVDQQHQHDHNKHNGIGRTKQSKSTRSVTKIKNLPAVCSNFDESLTSRDYPPSFRLATKQPPPTPDQRNCQKNSLTDFRDGVSISNMFFLFFPFSLLFARTDQDDANDESPDDARMSCFFMFFTLTHKCVFWSRWHAFNKFSRSFFRCER